MLLLVSLLPAILLLALWSTAPDQTVLASEVIASEVLASEAVPAADVKVFLSFSEVRPTLGQDVDVRILVLNSGDAPAEDVRIDILTEMAGSLGITGFESDFGTFDENAMMWTVGSVGVGQSREGTITGTWTGLHAIDVFTAQVAGSPDRFSRRGIVQADAGSDGGYALTLAGDDEYVEVADAAALDVTGTFTIAVWARPEPGSGGGHLVSHDAVGDDTDGAYNLAVSGNTVSYETNNQGGLSAPDVLDAGEWNHIVVTHSGGASPTTHIYVNGALVASGDVAAPSAVSAPVLIGRRGLSDSFFNGQLDEISIWNTALGGADIRARMVKPLSGSEAGLVAYYRFDENNQQGATAVDATGNGHDGVLQNGAGWAVSTIPMKGAPKLDIRLTSNVTRAAVGENVTFEVRVENEGPAVTGLRLDHFLRRGEADFVSAAPDRGTHDVAMSRWSLETLPGGASETMELVLTSREATSLLVLGVDATTAHQRRTGGNPLAGTFTAFQTVLPVQSATSSVLSLGGGAERMRVPFAPEMNAPEAFSAAAWVNVATGSSVSLFTRARAGGATGGNYGLNILADGRVEWDVQSFGFVTTSAGAVSRNQWHHVAVVWDDTAGEADGKLRIFVDGNLARAANTGDGGGPLQPTTSEDDLLIGSRASDLFMTGMVDDFTLWNKAISEEEIQETMTGGLLGNEKGLVLLHRYEIKRNLGVNNDGSDDAQDHSGHDLHGDLVGGAVFESTTLPKRATTVLASDDLQEDRIRVTWTLPEGETATLVQILRNGQLLDVVSSQNEEYEDGGGRPNEIHVYCVVTENGGGDRLVLGCDGGRRRLFKPGNMEASVERFTDRIQVLWDDLSTFNTGYNVYRDGVLVASLGGNTEVHDDASVASMVDHEYCVVPTQNGFEGNQAVCATGRRANVLPPAQVAATDGTVPAAVRVSWVDQGTGATGFEVRRDGALVAELGPDVRSFDDAFAVSGTLHAYCVRRLVGGDASIEVCDEGSINTLAAPTQATASVNTFDDRVEVEWQDETDHETGYNVYRQGGSALVFDGADDVVEIAADAAFDRPDMTFEAWLQPTAFGAVRSVMQKGDPRNFDVLLLEDGTLHFAAHSVTCAEFQSVNSAQPLPLGAWSHIAVSVSGSSVALIVNGFESATTPLAGVCTTSQPVALGGGRFSSFEGTMDEVRLWSGARTRAEVRATMHSRLNGDEDGLIAYWPLDSGSGGVANDAFSIHNGTLAGFDLTPAVPGWTSETAPFVQFGTGLAVRLDGADDRVVVDHVAALSLQQFTIETWMKPEPLIEEQNILGKMDADGGVAAPSNYALVRMPNSHIRLVMGPVVCSDPRLPIVESTFPVPPGRWTHVAATYDGTTARLFINGVLNRERELGAALCQNSEALVLGSNYAGSLDETRIWNEARTESDIRDNMHRAAPAAAGGLVAAISFDQALGSGDGPSGFSELGVTALAANARMAGEPALIQGLPALQAATATDRTDYVDVFAEPGVSYTYCVAAFTNQGVETDADCATGRRANALGADTVVATDAVFEDRVELSWTSTSTRTSVFKVYRDDTVLATLPLTTLSYTDKGIPSDTDLNYCVTSVSAEGVESPKVCDTGSRSMEVPTDVQASDGEFEGRVDITWVDNSEIERGYRVYRRAVLNNSTGELAADSSLVEETVASQAEATDRGGVPGTRYRYSVVAFDRDGFSRVGSAVGMRRLLTPASVAATDAETETSIRVTWDDRSRIERGYRIYRDGVEIATVDKNVTAFVDENPPFGAEFTYAVEAFDDLGPSAQGSDTGSTTLLAPGTVGTSTSWTDRVSITWVDQSAVEDGYRITKNGTQIADVAQNVTSFEDTSPTVNVADTYCVRTLKDGSASTAKCDIGFAFVAEPPPDFIPLNNSLSPEDGNSNDEFGIEVATAGDQMLIGAWFHKNNTGAVYVYERQSSGWVFRQKLIASDSKPGARFGVAISMTSTWAVIGSPTHSNAFGSESSSVGLAEGTVSDFGRIYYFKRTPDGWEERQAQTHDNLFQNAQYGAAISTDGNFSLILSPGDGQGSLYIQQRNGDTWEVVDSKGGLPGTSAAISDNFAAFAATQPGSEGFFQIIERVGDAWNLGLRLAPVSAGDGGAEFGSAVSIDQGLLAVGARGVNALDLPASGAVYIYELVDRNTVNLLQVVVPDEHSSNQFFGKDVSLRGGKLLVGANEAAYLFERDDNGQFVQSSVFRNGDNPSSLDFGRSVSISQEGVIVIGDPREIGGQNGNTPSAGKIFFQEADPTPPANVMASNGEFQNRVELAWEDRSDNEDGFRIFRDGELVEVTGADVTSFNDVNAVPGNVHEYCVQSLRAVFEDVSENVCNIGWRFPDGAMAGKVANNLAAAAQNIEVCLDPTPNGSLSLDGFKGDARSNDSTTLPSSFTVEFWLKRSDGTTGKDIAFSHGTPGQNTGLLAGFRADDTFTFGFFLNDLNGPQITDVRWHHFALTYDAGTGRRAIVHNGAEVASDTSVPYAGNGPFFLGTQHGGDHFNGQIDEVRIWDHVVPLGIINARMHETINARLPDLGLFAHWSLDERDGDFSANDIDISGSYYLNHNGGVHPARPGAPLRACDITDPNGDYSFTGVRYGESTEFTLTPQDPGDVVRTFSPTRRLLSLSRENPVQNEVPFTDLTQHNIAGVVQFDGTECPVTDALFTVRTGTSQFGGPVQSDEDGDYSIAADPGNVTVTPSVNGDPTRIFNPDILSFPDLDGDVFDQNLVDLTTRTLSGQVAGTGMCRLPIGRATLEIRARNGCMTRVVTTDEEGNYSVDLPPMEYTVRLLSIDNDNAVQRVDIEAFFEEQGAQVVDLTEGATEHNLIYRPGLQIQIAGLEPSMCNTSQIPDNTPILAKGDKVDLTITVVEDLGAAGVCPVDTGTVTLFSEISDQTNNPMTFEIAEDSGGRIDTTIVVGQPNVLRGRVVDGEDRTFQKFITASADVDGVLGEETEWAFVEGVRARPGGRFATAPNTPIPTWILRDPPGDASFSYIEEGSEVCNIFSGEAAFGGALTFHAALDLGVVADVGVAFGGEATVEFEGVQAQGFSITAALRQTLGGATEICTRANTRIQTSDDSDFFGPDADVFVGAGVNFIFAKADVVDIDENECTVELDDTIAFGPELETGFAFTREHIENRLIPDLDELAAVSTPDSTAIFQSAIENWNQMLSDSKETLQADDLDPFEKDRRNRSFNAGAEFGFEKSRSEAQSFFTETELSFSSELWLLQRVGAAGNVVEAGLSLETFVSGLFRFETVSTDNTVYGYALSDDDQGDNFSVDILEDPEFKTPTFDVKAGLSSCPFEPWLGLPLVAAGDADPSQIAPRMTPRDLPELSMNPIQRLGLDPASAALFTVNLGNASASDETRNYRLATLPTSNPFGAVMEAAGTRLGMVDFTIPSGEVHQTQLSVSRGPEKFNYPRLGLVMYPVCEQDNLVRGEPLTADTLFFDVSYTPPCSDISIFRPKENWTLSRETVSDPMEIILNEFTLAENDVDAGVQNIGFEYRRIGTSDWLPGDSYDRTTIIAQGGPDADSFIAEWTFPADDGLYEIRAWTECENGRNFSEVVVGRVDTVLPEVLKTPSPADGVLHFGDDIAAEFTEPMLCSSIITGGQNPNTTLTRLDTDAIIPIGATCDGRMVVLSPQDQTALDDLEGVTLQAAFEGWTDLGGNPVETSVSWQFDVQRSAFIWSPTAVSITLETGTTGTFAATLTNGEPTDGVDFTLASDSDWLVPNVTTGSIPAQSQGTIDFVVQNLTVVGEHVGRVTATSSTGDESVLTVSVTAFDECDVPVWDVNPADFQHNMTLTAQLFVSGVVSTDENDMVAAFVNGEIRGVAPIAAIDADGNEEPDGNRVNMIIYSNQESGEQVTFTTFDASACDIHTTSSLTLTFDATAVNGTPEQPVTLQAPRPDAVPGEVALSSGWTWFSINVVPPDARVSSILANVPAAEANVVKSQRFFSLFDPAAGWVGTLPDLDPREGYLIKLDQSHNLGMVGVPVDVATTPIDLVSGWNWIGFMPQAALGVNEALESLTPVTNDIVKSQFEFAQFVEGSGWIGSLTAMEPGLGYQIRLAQEGVLTYPDAGPPPALALGGGGVSPDGADAAAIRASAKRVPDGPLREHEGGAAPAPASASAPAPRFKFSEGLECTVNPGNFQFSLTLTAAVFVDGLEMRSEQFEIGAFTSEESAAGDASATECRGLGRLQYVESLDRWLAFVVVYANEEGEPIDLKVFDPASSRVLETDKVLSFSSNAVFGSVQQPIEIGATTALSTATEDEALPRVFSLEANYPNPFNDITTIRYDVPRPEEVRVTVYDVLGRRIAMLVNAERAAGRYELRFDARDLAPGMYAYRLEAGSFVETKFMILAR